MFRLQPFLMGNRSLSTLFSMVLLFARLLTSSEGPDSIFGNYLLGPGDEVTINVSNLPELSGGRIYRVDPQGNFDMPVVGSLHAAGQSLTEVRTAIAEALKQYVYHPDVSLGVSQFRSQPVSIIGAVNESGVHQLEGKKTLLEVIAMAKGLRSDAGDSLHITRELSRGSIPLANSRLDAAGRFYTADVNLAALIDGKSPENNIPVESDDVVSIPPADLVYVIGAVTRPGGFVLSQRKNMSVLQALSLAGGLSKNASAKNARILRPTGQIKPVEILLNVNSILRGKSEDLKLNASDILFIPDSAAKTALGKVAETALQAATGAAVYRPW
ncbi:MAG TPA: polysaccharide biosynthesis/export family protein [Edaphobacter sp.]|nr:polysaccharide biosynthesis/export family protein [Edaphobacter sp.]